MSFTSFTFLDILQSPNHIPLISPLTIRPTCAVRFRVPRLHRNPQIPCLYLSWPNLGEVNLDQHQNQHIVSTMPMDPLSPCRGDPLSRNFGRKCLNCTSAECRSPSTQTHTARLCTVYFLRPGHCPQAPLGYLRASWVGRVGVVFVRKYRMVPFFPRSPMMCGTTSYLAFVLWHTYMS